MKKQPKNKGAVMHPFNSGRWTQARFDSFVRSALRGASMRWPPKYEVKKAARVERGKYKCIGYKRRSHIVPASLPPKEGNKRRINNVQIDHIIPIVPINGRSTWDEVIANLFCEIENLQVLCHECHKKKTGEEREMRKKAKEK